MSPHTPLDAALLDFNALSPSHKFCGKARLRWHDAQIVPHHLRTFASHKWLLEASLGISWVTGILCDGGEHAIACVLHPFGEGVSHHFIFLAWSLQIPLTLLRTVMLQTDSMRNVSPLLFPWLLHKFCYFYLQWFIQKFFRVLSMGFCAFLLQVSNLY